MGNVNVDQFGPVTNSPSLKLNNCLLIPSLSHKLLSISQLTWELNCTVLISSSNCVVQDAQTGRIIGRGTERGDSKRAHFACSWVPRSLVMDLASTSRTSIIRVTETTFSVIK